MSVVGDFNLWDGRRHAMRVRGDGFWEIFVPEARAGDKYKYEIVGPDSHLIPLKSDSLAFADGSVCKGLRVRNLCGDCILQSGSPKT